MFKKFYYIEQIDGERVVKRIPTTLDKANIDKAKIEMTANKAHQVDFVVSSVEEKIIN